MGKSKPLGIVCLLLCAMIWGFAFVAQVQGMDLMSPLFFNAVRFALGALSLAPLVLARSRRKTKLPELATNRADGISSGAKEDVAFQTTSMRWATHPAAVSLVCGAVLFGASTLQQYGILYCKSAGRSGFLSALYIVMVPLLAFVFLRRRINILIGAAVALAVAGFYCLCITDGFGSLGMADVVLVLSAVLFAAHILVIDTLGSRVDAIALSFGQICTAAALSFAGALMEGSVDWVGAFSSWIPLAYAGIGSVGIAYTLQVVGQRWVPPTSASLLMSLESLFSVVGGALLLGEVMTPRAYVGCALIFLGTLLAQIRIPSRLFNGRAS